MNKEKKRKISISEIREHEGNTHVAWTLSVDDMTKAEVMT